MKSLAQTDQIQTCPLALVFEKLSKHFIKPMAAGLQGFFMILMIIFFIHFFSYVIRFNNKLVFDYVDLLLAGFGFMLRFAADLIKSFM
jgi:hypothetical protein